MLSSRPLAGIEGHFAKVREGSREGREDGKEGKRK